MRRNGNPPAPSDARLLRWMVLGGIAGVVAMWASEAAQDRVAAWDRVLYPLALLWLVLTAATLTWRPRWEPAARLSAVVGLNLVVLVELGMVLATGSRTLDLYQFVAALFWAPLGLGCAFVFLPVRQALLISGLVYACEFGPAMWLLARHGLDAGAADLARALLANAAVVQPLYVLMLVGVSLMRHHMLRANERAERLQQAASTDPLTGLANRRALDDWLPALLDAVRLDRRRACVFLIDVDHFKAVNDRHGHPVGDVVLVELSRLLASQLRAGDRVGRWGGEEFLALVHDTVPPHALELAERLRTAVQAHRFAKGLQVTVSIGVAACAAGDGTVALLERVDRALYAAKTGGRNRVCAEPERANI